MTGKVVMKNIKTNFGKQIIILSVALLIALPVRVYQYLGVIDGTTGFYNSWTNPTVFGLYGLCALVIILEIVLALKGSKNALYTMPDGKRMPLGIASLAGAVAFLAEGGYNAFRLVSISSGQLPVQQLVLGDNIGKSSFVFTALQTVFALLSAVYFCLLAAGYLTGKAQYKKANILSVAPAIWGVARLMLDFTQTISYRYVSELMFDLLMVVFICMFCVAFAKLNVGTLEKRVQMRVFSYGLLAVFFALLNAVPRYIMLLMGRQDLLYRQSAVAEVTDLVLPVFIMVFIFALASTKHYKSVEEYAVAEEGEQE